MEQRVWTGWPRTPVRVFLVTPAPSVKPTLTSVLRHPVNMVVPVRIW